MTLVARTYWGGAPYHFRERPAADVEPLLLRTQDFREISGLYWTPAGRPRPPVAVVCMHPRVDFTRHYSFPRLLAAGIGCLGANTRNPNNDVASVHEDLLLDVAECVRFLKHHRGARRVILVGNSGGGSLAAYFQAEARLAPAERTATTPGGRPTRLAEAELIPADGLVYLSAHRGEGHVMGSCIDPSVTDETDPLSCDRDLDMYDPANGFAPPPAWSSYEPGFVEGYRAAQRARVERIDARARELLADAAEARGRAAEPGFDERPFGERQRIERRKHAEPVILVYRTMANLHYVDRSLDPSGRDYGSLLSDRPDLMNVQLLGFGRMATAEAWLSTWSPLASRADLVANVARITEPTLLVSAGRDREIYPRSDTAPIARAIASPDRTHVELPDALHYFEPEPGERHSPAREELMDHVVGWIEERFAP